VSFGVINGESHELVYEDGVKVSELIWRLDDVPMLGLSASLELPGPVAFNLAGWTKLGEPSSFMEDYDWIKASRPNEWSHYSRSATTLTKGEMVDANFVIPLLKKSGGVLSAVLGFRRDHWRWEDWGGWYIYSSNAGFRDLTGVFPEGTGITFEQWFYAPYLGVQLDFRFSEEFQLSGRFAGSKWAWSEDNDHHIMRDIVFKDYFDHVTYVTFGAEASYFLSESLSLSVSVDAQKYARTVGDTDIFAPGETVSFDEGAGLEHSSWMAAFSFGYTF